MPKAFEGETVRYCVFYWEPGVGWTEWNASCRYATQEDAQKQADWMNRQDGVDATVACARTTITELSQLEGR